MIRIIILSIGLALGLSMEAQAISDVTKIVPGVAGTTDTTLRQGVTVPTPEQKRIEELTAVAAAYTRKLSEIRMELSGDSATLASLNSTYRQNDLRLLGYARICLTEPYSKNMIAWVGLTAFDAIQDTTLKKDNEICRTLLTHQGEYADQLRKFFQEWSKRFDDAAHAAEKQPSGEVGGNPATGTPSAPVAGPSVEEMRKAFVELPVCQDYMLYGEGWTETWLGRFIHHSLQTLENMTPDTAPKAFQELLSGLDALNIK